MAHWLKRPLNRFKLTFILEKYMTKKIKMPKDNLTKLSRRNPMHDHPLLRKGGAHRKTNKSKRRLDKVKVKKEWLPKNIFTTIYFSEAIHSEFKL